MIRTLTKLLALKKAPKTTLAILSPMKFLKWGAAFVLAKKLVQSFRSA